jgi:hypothetical protein
VDRALDDARLYRFEVSSTNETAGIVVARPVRETRAHPTSAATIPIVATLALIEVDTR